MLLFIFHATLWRQSLAFCLGGKVWPFATFGGKGLAFAFCKLIKTYWTITKNIEPYLQDPRPRSSASTISKISNMLAMTVAAAVMLLVKA
jgi:hypothetical protein